MLVLTANQEYKKKEGRILVVVGQLERMQCARLHDPVCLRHLDLLAHQVGKDKQHLVAHRRVGRCGGSAVGGRGCSRRHRRCRCRLKYIRWVKEEEEDIQVSEKEQKKQKEVHYDSCGGSGSRRLDSLASSSRERHDARPDSGLRRRCWLWLYRQANWGWWLAGGRNWGAATSAGSSSSSAGGGRRRASISHCSSPARWS